MNSIHKNHRRKIRIASKKRFTIFISILLMLAFPAIMFAIDKPPSTKNQDFIKVYIEPGDTLWGIAKTNLPPRMDIREFVHDIKVVNQLDSALIKVGETLLVPTQP